MIDDKIIQCRECSKVLRYVEAVLANPADPTSESIPCAYGQHVAGLAATAGYWLATPMPPDQQERWLSDHYALPPV